jgi:hypothetical protein
LPVWRDVHTSIGIKMDLETERGRERERGVMWERRRRGLEVRPEG